jgi:DNA-binding NarL/FixJ family response regulator
MQVLIDSAALNPERQWPSIHMNAAMMSMRVLIVDDHEFIRSGLRSLLGESPNCEIVDEADNGVDAVEKAQAEKPDVVVLDISMPKMNGLDACRIIRETIPSCEVLIVSQHHCAEVQKVAHKAGARGYVVKSELRRDLLPAIEAVSQHETFSSAA